MLDLNALSYITKKLSINNNSITININLISLIKKSINFHTS